MKSTQLILSGLYFLVAFIPMHAQAEEQFDINSVLMRFTFKHAQSQGHELFNQKGVRMPVDTISFSGNKTTEAIAPRIMLTKQTSAKAKKTPMAKEICNLPSSDMYLHLNKR